MSLYRKELFPDGGGWAVWHVTESPAELMEMLPSGGCYQKEISSFKASSSRMKERLATRVLMFDCWGKEYEVAYTAAGKPYLSGNVFHISISHTKGYAAVCWHPSRAVSIDIEMIRPKALSLKERFVHPDEQVEGDEVHASLLLWSMKETLFKIIDNQEAVNFRSHLFINPFKISPEGMSYGLDRRNPDMLYKLDYWVDSDFVLTRIG